MPPIDDDAIVTTMNTLLDRRAPDATICPSDVARALVDGEAAWRALMPDVRRIAATLAAQGLLRVTRRGEVVIATSPGGPIRLGRPRRC